MWQYMGAGGAGATTGGHGGAVAAGKSFAFALHIRISNRTDGNFSPRPPIREPVFLPIAH